jgi:putative ABC transport system permease protein
MDIAFDLRQTLRGLRRAKGLTIGAALALALGIGAVTTLFSIVHGALRELPFDRAEQLRLITRTANSHGFTGRGSNQFDYATWSGSVRSFEALTAFSTTSVNLSGDGSSPARISGAEVAANLLSVLRVRPRIGRDFTAQDAAAGAPATAIIGHRLWQTRFDSDPNIIGRVITLNGTAHTVIGVMADGFGFPVNHQIWLPLVVKAAPQPDAGDWLTVFGRLRDRMSVDQADAELNGIAARVARDHPASHKNVTITTAGLTEMELDRSARTILYIMLLAVSFVLVIACANVANLLLARAAARSRETAIRGALGASRARIVTQHLIESLMISVLGGLGGLAIAFSAVRVFDRATAGLLEAFWMDFRVDRVALLLAFGLIALAGVLAGVVPALRASAIPVASLLKESTASGIRIGRLSRALVVAELTLACGLLVVSGVLVKSAVSQHAIDFPFAENEIYTAQLAFMQGQLNDAQRREQYLRSLKDQLETIPGVQSAALSSALPGRGAGYWGFTLDGRKADRAEDRLYSAAAMITPDFFKVLDTQVLRGRDLTWSDRAGTLRVALVNQSWVRRFSSDRDPIGRTLQLEGEASATIVGIVPDVHMEDPDSQRPECAFVSALQFNPYGVRVLLRSRGDVIALTPDVRARVAQVDPDLPIFEIATLHDAIYSDSAILDVFAALFGVFGVGALFLTTIGLYGVVSFSVTQRTREIGIRISLGATRRGILALILKSGGKPLALGAALGVLVAIAISAGLAASGEDVLKSDPLVFVGVFAAVGITAIAALLIPATRAARLQPVDALRLQ